MNIRYPIYEGVYRILTYKNKTYGRYYNFIAGVLGSGQAFEGRVRRIQQKQFSG